MSGVGERQVTGGNGGIFQTEKSHFGLSAEGFWLGCTAPGFLDTSFY